MKRLQKRYYVIIFIVALVTGMAIRDFENHSFEIVKNSGAYAPISEMVTIPETEAARININTADVYELERLNGIGTALAERIIEYRTKNGNFEMIEDIMKVQGIGTKKFEDIKSYITVK